MKKIVTFGEIMLRLKSPANERLFQSPTLEATFGGGEANVAVGLARFGMDANFVSVIPDNQVGDACIGELRKYGVGTSNILRKGSRLGLYYLETGANQRPSLVVYDRAGSAIAEVKKGDIDWEKVFQDTAWFHITGITPAISESASNVALESVMAAKAKGITVSCDLNYRKNLWKYGKKADEVMSELVKYVDVIIANEEDCQKALGISVNSDVESGELNLDNYKELTDKVFSKYHDLSKIAITLRESHSADYNSWSGVLSNKKEFFHSKKYEIHNIVDRVGGGDSFACGLIYGFLELGSDKEALEFAVACSCLKHSISGDLPLITLGEVKSLVGGSGSGRVIR